MPKVTIAINSVGGGGGTQRVAMNLAQGLGHQGIEVELVALMDGPRSFPIPVGVQVINLNTSNVRRSLGPFIEYCRKVKPEVILSLGDEMNWLVIAARLVGRLPCRVVISQHAPLFWATKPHESLKKRVVPWINRALYRFADEVVAVSQGVAQELIDMLGLPPEKVHTIYNPVVSEAMLERAKAPMDPPVLPTDSVPTIIALGHLIEPKGFDTLIRAFHLVVQEMPCRLLILGEGHRRRDLEELGKKLGVADRVLLPGFVSNPYPHIAAADVLALSSWWESLSIVLIEALALGTPVVAADCDFGPREVLEHGRYGTLVPVRDHQAMAQALLGVLRGPRRSCPPEALTRFTEQSATAAYTKLLFPA